MLHQVSLAVDGLDSASPHDVDGELMADEVRVLEASGAAPGNSQGPPSLS
jgi:hypothetical protein